jgi:hypothetical protein
MRAFFGTVLIVGGLWIVWPSLGTPDAKMKAFASAVIGVAALFGVDIHGIAKEDAAEKASDVKNQPVPTSETVVPSPPAAQPFTPAQMAAMQQVFSAMLAPHLKARVQQPPIDHPKGA